VPAFAACTERRVIFDLWCLAGLCSFVLVGALGLTVRAVVFDRTRPGWRRVEARRRAR
jgi:hypothetical protein